MILISVGNTHTLFAQTQDGNDFCTARLPSAQAPAAMRQALGEPWISWWQQEEIFVAGVVPAAVRAWQEELRDCRLPDWDPEHFHRLLPSTYTPPESLGFDRRCCLLGAWQEVDGGAALVIDAGTAITVDTLAAGRFCGGWILPGLQSQLDCLHRQTAQLPRLLPATDIPRLGTDTAGCMQAGIWHGVVANLRAAIGDFLAEHPHGMVFLTGGDGPRLHPQLPATRHNPLLLLRGFALLVQKSVNTSKT
jgi:type III pantothenate kinase